MAITTRWIDTTDNNLVQILTRFLEETEEKCHEDKASYININVTKAFDKNKTFEFNDKKVEYNLINYTYDSVYPGNEPLEDRKSPVNGKIIVYYKSNKLNYIIDKNTNALTELRWLIGYKGKLEIAKNESPINSELLIWIISRLFKEENILNINLVDGSDIALVLNSIVGFKGQTDDQISYVSADGDSILNILSTLSFLLESKLLQQIKLRMQLDEHENIEITLKDTKTIAVNINKYDGPFDDYSKDQKYAEIYLLTYLEIMPMLYSKYQEDMDNSLWGPTQKKAFLASIKEKLIKKISEKEAGM